MTLPETLLTKADFDATHWQELLNAAPQRKCWKYYKVLLPHAREAEMEGRVVAQAVFSLLGGIASLVFNLDSKSEPLKPAEPQHLFGSIAIDDLTTAHLDALRDIVTEVRDAEMRARIADIIVIKRNDYKLADLAVESYIEAAKVLEQSEQWEDYKTRIERAIQITLKFGRKNGVLTLVITYINEAIERHKDEDLYGIAARLMEYLQKYHLLEPAKYDYYAEISEALALRKEASTEPMKWSLAQYYWRINSKWHSLRKDKEQERQALIHHAKTYASEARDMIARKGPNAYSTAASQIQLAIEALRGIKNTLDQRDELHRELIDYQSKMAAEVELTNLLVNPSDWPLKARNWVSGHSPHNALLALASLTVPPSVAILRETVLAKLKASPLYYVFPALLHNAEGKQVGYREAVIGGDSIKESDLRAEMLKEANDARLYLAIAIIEPARDQINTEYDIRVGDFLPFVFNNPLIPHKRAEIYARGLHAGLVGDFLTASHLLIPQVENSVRYILEKEELIPSGIDHQGTQNEYDLNKILYEKYRSKLEEKFGEDMVFDFQGLLVERFGFNMRNLLAHGLLNEDYFESYRVSYCWWAILRFCCLPFLVHRAAQNQQET